MSIFSNTLIKMHKNNTNTVNRVKIIHHVRNIDVHNFLKGISDIEIAPTKGLGEDEYTMRCQNLLNNCAEGFLSYMWNIDVNEAYKFDSKIKPDMSKSNFFLSRNNGEATIIFTSLTNERQAYFVKNANEWSKRKGLNLYFIAINGDNMKTDYAENIANFEISIRENNHIVFVTANMAARSFSVPKIVNGIMMVNEPALASAEQKYNRLSTFDYDNQNKIGNMYWFNFNSMKCVCPLYTMLYNDVLENKKKKDINGKSLVNMFDCIDIFEQYDQTMKEKTHKWEENDIFDCINKGTISHDEVTAHIVNFCPEIEDAVAEMIKKFEIDVVSLNTKNWKIGKTLQKKLNAGRSKETKKKSKNEEKEKKVRILNLEVATSLVGLILSHSKEDRDFDCFVTDACHIFSSDVVEKIGKKEMKNLWKVFENCIVNLAFRC